MSPPRRASSQRHKETEGKGGKVRVDTPPHPTLPLLLLPPLKTPLPIYLFTYFPQEERSAFALCEVTSGHGANGEEPLSSLIWLLVPILISLPFTGVQSTSLLPPCSLPPAIRLHTAQKLLRSQCRRKTRPNKQKKTTKKPPLILTAHLLMLQFAFQEKKQASWNRNGGRMDQH